MISSANFKPYWNWLPNGLTFLRMGLGIVIPFLIWNGSAFSHMAAIVLFAIGAVSDYWDGALARKFDTVSNFGKIMDPIADKVLILGPLGSFVGLGFFSVWWVVPVFTREIVITFCRIGWLHEGKVVGAEMLGKYKFGAQVFLVSMGLLYLVTFDFSLLNGAGGLLRLLMLVSLVMTLVLTVVSGISMAAANIENFKTPAFAKFTSALGVGLLPAAPGTWGSLVGLGLVFLLQVNEWLYGATFLMLLLSGWWAVSRLPGKAKDPSYVVVDEACGIMMAFMGISLAPAPAAIGFVLFRFFDVVKPYPVYKLEKIPGYWGILLDDLGAGIYTWILLKLLF